MDPALAVTLIVTSLVFTGIWLIHVSTEDAGVIDFYWGPGFAVIGFITMAFHGTFSIEHTIFMAAITLWAARLTWHLGTRHMRATSEDGRYREMRSQGGKTYWWASLFKVFLLQAVILWVIATPVHIAMRTSVAPDFNVLVFGLGLAIFAVGFVIESVADAQLVRGKKQRAHSDASPQIVEQGLWAMSRHPNYLGEIILWWGLGVSAFAISGSLFALGGPLLLTGVIMGVSLPLTEQWLEKSRPNYAAYKQRVPKLLPRVSAIVGQQQTFE
ncbi:MAG: DUF1295 domain-containing protein [Ahrensia sp.]